MSYFRDVKVSSPVYGLVYGKGKVVSIWEDGFYSFEVQYDNGQTVPYTEDGIPGWANFEYQTVFYPEDIDLTNEDISPSEKVLTPKRIIKLRNKGKLQIKCPSGIWTDTDKCPNNLMEKYLEDNMLHLFRKKPKG